MKHWLSPWTVSVKLLALKSALTWLPLPSFAAATASALEASMMYILMVPPSSPHEYFLISRTSLASGAAPSPPAAAAAGPPSRWPGPSKTDGSWRPAMGGPWSSGATSASRVAPSWMPIASSVFHGSFTSVLSPPGLVKKKRCSLPAGAFLATSCTRCFSAFPVLCGSNSIVTGAAPDSCRITLSRSSAGAGCRASGMRAAGPLASPDSGPRTTPQGS
mmetsp:Transcript_42632/g.127421  ORF Transcript_42632/g.127421 Transcript_42632/m.127421 type:complete len:218 (+) Transcript_42632:383-1036(+)